MNAVLFLDHASGLGGAEQSLLMLMRRLSEGSYQPHLASPDGELARRALSDGIDWHEVDYPRLRRSTTAASSLWRTAADLSRIAGAIDASIMYGNTVRATLYGQLAARRLGSSFVWHMRDFWLSESAPRFGGGDWLGKRALIGAATQVIANSEATARHLPASPKVTVVHNGVETARFLDLATGPAFRASVGIPADAPLIGMVGRLRPWKGQTRFVSMAARLAQRVPEAHFAIVGGTPLGESSDYLAELKALISNNGLDPVVHLVGHLDDPRPPLAAFDVFVHPGDPEPFGLVTVEAMAAAKPVVAFAHGALPEIVAHGRTGWLVQPYLIDEMADRVRSMVENATSRHDFGEAGRQRALNHFSAAETAAQVQRVLDQVALPDRNTEAGLPV